MTWRRVKTVYWVNALVKKKISKNDTFLPSEANFEDFFKIPKIRNLKRIASHLLRVSQSSHKSYLRLKSHFWCFLDLKNSSYFEVKKSPKIRFYDQVSSVWWFWYSQKLTCNKFEVSDFWNFEKIFKIHSKRQKRVIFTKMLFSLRRNKTSSVNPMRTCFATPKDCKKVP